MTCSPKTGRWRAALPDGTTGDYGVLEAIARNKLNPKKVITQWPDMLRVAGSLVTNQARAYDLLRMLAGTASAAVVDGDGV